MYECIDISMVLTDHLPIRATSTEERKSKRERVTKVLITKYVKETKTKKGRETYKAGSRMVCYDTYTERCYLPASIQESLRRRKARVDRRREKLEKRLYRLAITKVTWQEKRM